MEIKYFDIHSHIGFDDYGGDIKDVIKRMHENGVATITIGTGLESSKEAVRIAEANENIWACIGAHPDDNSDEIFDENEYGKLVKSPKVVAIGECGLDYSRISNLESVILEEIKNKQKKEFEKQIDFALKFDKPLMLHIRDAKKVIGESAYDDAYDILYSKFKISSSTPRGNLHFFTSNIINAKRFIDLGFTVSFPGLITYVRDFDKIIKNIPLDKIHAETDAPYVAPVPHRGERNEPSYVIEMYKKIAEIRGEDFEKVRLQLLENAKTVFSITV